MNQMQLFTVVGVIAFLFVSFFTVANTYERHYYVGKGDNKQLYKALHIALPGYTTIYYPEQEVDLQKWTGSKYDGLVAVNKKDGTENLEVTASFALKAMGLYTDYKLKEKNGHYILHRPEKTTEIFTWKAYYRIWKGKKAES
ncbi:hypothetical protein ACFLZC_01125 [Patescibacteria group bacterium]